MKESNIYSNAALRKILLSILWAVLPTEASCKYLDKQKKIAGATEKEIKE
ncbi:MAG: hypothetical protein OK457_00485 [Thaumarchaeota archaeon]|nr:hypothetical protein [Nitrososphaerota archaeon]